jgi:tight adherence protein B
LLELIFVGITGLATLCFVLLLFSVFGREPGKDIQDRMHQYLVESEMAAKEYAPPEEEFEEDKKEDFTSGEDEWIKEGRAMKGQSGMKKLLNNVGTIITPKGMAMRIALKLGKADIPLKANEFMAIKFLAGTILLSIGMMFSKSILIGAVVGFLGFFAPEVWLMMRLKNRVAAFSEQILDTLVMLANGLKAGYSFLQAMEMVARESPAPMSTELKRVLKENSLGMNLEDCLRGLNERVESEDWDLVTTVVLIQRQVGGNLAEILDKIGFTIRQRMKIKGDIQTKTAQAKVSGALVGALPLGIGFMIYLINPKFIMLLFTFKHEGFRGWFVVIFGAIWEVIGMAIIMKIVDIEV